MGVRLASVHRNVLRNVLGNFLRRGAGFAQALERAELGEAVPRLFIDGKWFEKDTRGAFFAKKVTREYLLSRVSTKKVRKLAKDFEAQRRLAKLSTRSSVKAESCSTLAIACVYRKKERKNHASLETPPRADPRAS